MGAMLVCVAMIFTGCGVMNQLTTNVNMTETSVQLTSGNYKVVKTVSGEATDTYVFGIGGLSKDALAKNSYAEMVRNANLKDKREMVTSGVVIEFCK